MPSKLLDQLNESQRQAVIHPGGPLLILAGAGSGKTRALTYRAAYLLQEKGVAPHQILLTTFTNKAAQEMQERLQSLVGARLPFAGTFHSLCARLLRIHGQDIGISKNFVIYDTQDQINVIKQAMRDLGIDPREHRPRSILYAIEQAKNELVTPADYAGFARGPFQKAVAKVFARYQQLLLEYQALDFNDLLVEAVRLFQTVEPVRNRYQSQFVHVLIDEYQDTNRPQYMLSKLLSGKYKNLTVVGDASQAIYSWRGADYKNLMLLQTDFPDLTTIKLEQNYRSTQNILDAAYGVIANNALHPILSLWTQAEGGQPVTIYQAKSERDEAQFVLNTIKTIRTNHPNVPLSDFAVLYRTNAQSRIFEEIFIRAGMPYVLVGGVKFYERAEVKDVLAYLRYLSNPKDQVSLDRITKLGKRRLATFQSWMAKADPTVPPAKLLETILNVTGYLDKYDAKNQEDLARIENVQELFSVAQNFDNLPDFLENVALVEQDTKKAGLVTPKAAIYADDKPDAVILMTLHSSKGLEFDHVFLVGMEEGLFPHSRSLLSKADLEEERRLCYVGITRAKSKVYLTYATDRLYFGTRAQNQPSRFLSELPSSVLDQTVSPSVSSSTSPINDEALDKFLDGEIDIAEFLQS